MTLEMRELKGDDIFTLLGIVGKLDIKDEFVKMFEKNVAEERKLQDFKKKEPTKAEKEKLQKAAEKRGMLAAANLLQKTLLNAGKIKPEINGLLADLTDTSVEEIQELNLKDYTGLIIKFFRKKELQDFFSSIASLLQ